MDRGGQHLLFGSSPLLVRDSYLARPIRRIPILQGYGKGFPLVRVRERIRAPASYSPQPTAYGLRSTVYSL